MEGGGTGVVAVYAASPTLGGFLSVTEPPDTWLFISMVHSPSLPPAICQGSFGIHGCLAPMAFSQMPDGGGPKFWRVALFANVRGAFFLPPG